MPNEIIVYLDDYKYGGDGNYSTMYLDFRTASDYNRYMEKLGLKEHTVGSYLQIDDYQSPKRLCLNREVCHTIWLGRCTENMRKKLRKRLQKVI